MPHKHLIIRQHWFRKWPGAVRRPGPVLTDLRHPMISPLQWRHNGRDSVSNHRPHDYLFNRLFRHRSKKTSKLCVTGLCEGNSPVPGELPAQRASNAENVSIWWHHHAISWCSAFVRIVEILITCWISLSYFTSVAIAQLRWHLSIWM